MAIIGIRLGGTHTIGDAAALDHVHLRLCHTSVAVRLVLTIMIKTMTGIIGSILLWNMIVEEEATG
jgi:hypothetical protein